MNPNEWFYIYLYPTVLAVGRFLYHISPALVVVGIGGYLVNRFFVRERNASQAVERICCIMSALCTDCADYWTKDAASIDRPERLAYEARIKGALLQIQKELTFVESKYKVKINERQLFEEMMVDLCTGGDFEGTKRKADSTRYLKIVNVISDLSSRLASSRI